MDRPKHHDMDRLKETVVEKGSEPWSTPRFRDALSSFIPPRWPRGKASASRAEDPGFESRLRWDFFGVQSYQ